ncbi:hypothetical protein BC828DRAFT_386946 [Blastocladiella britannica]|nr:hypothetical protein BC828DRAFT_386946 [Blastocladiella britannica]
MSLLLRSIAATKTATAVRTVSWSLAPALTRAFHVPKRAREAMDANTDLREIVDEYTVPGKFQHLFFPSKRQQKRDAELVAPSHPRNPTKGTYAMQQYQQQGKQGKPMSKRMSQRVSRALHDILYDPAFGVTADGSEYSASWRVDKIDVAGTADVTVWWVPTDDVSAAVLFEEEHMVAELKALAKLVKGRLQGKLKLRANEMPQITFMRRDVGLNFMLDIVADEMELEEMDAAPELQLTRDPLHSTDPTTATTLTDYAAQAKQ